MTTVVDLTRAVEALGERGAQHVLAEGGPTLNGELARAGLLDELCVSLSPLLASGDAKRIIAGSTLEELTRLRLHSICERTTTCSCATAPADLEPKWW